jgi:hypothetical protein
MIFAERVKDREAEMEKNVAIIPVDRIEPLILVIRGKKVMLDTDLAQLHGVSTKRLNEQVKRNRNRFPVDFMFQLNAAEVNNLRSHFATSVKGLCHAKAPSSPRKEG